MKNRRLIIQYMDVTLREFEENDIPLKVEWINNPDNNKYLHYDLPLQIDKTIKWFHSKDNTQRIDCIIEYNGIPIGLIGLLKIDIINSKAEYYITIGDPLFKNKGIAAKATKAILNYSSHVLNLHKIFLTVDSRNAAAIKLYQKSGFKQKGYFANGTFYNTPPVFMDNKQNYPTQLYFEFITSKSKATEIQNLKHADKDNLLFIKRDDLIPVSFGGNKTRKAINFFREIDEGEYNSVVTYGSSSSNHCRIISNMAAARNIPCYIISPEESSKTTFNSKMMELFNAKITVVPVINVHNAIEEKLYELKSKNAYPYFIPGGGHGIHGTQAYVDCYEEIIDYEKQNDIFFDYIFLASGTGTTQAGLICGQILHNDIRKIIGISIARKNPRGRQIILDSIHEYLKSKRYDVPLEIIDAATTFIDDYTINGYGKENSAITKTICDMLIRYGIPMDSTYTAKAYTGMLDYIKKENIKNKNILFVHTGGTPLFFNDLEKMQR